ncbi:hypothetical protein GcM3_122021 [Golovinomyces cichoracearum]|uniref:Secreted effector protein n=1 Tax=Golovinomyces cichoracearum TaxID=62708 RepID=A0A420I6M5_9PEZI|nr:hypothetical protein GcM3_122021 [Golovinomyces cichoracearum]
MSLRSYIILCIFISVHIFACVKAAGPSIKFVPSLSNIGCTKGNSNLDKQRFGQFKASDFIGVRFSKKQIDIAAKNVCAAVDKFQSCKGARICRVTNKFSEKPIPYRGGQFPNRDGSEFYQSHLFERNKFGDKDYRGVVRWNPRTRECEGVGAVKLTSTGSSKCLF